MDNENKEKNFMKKYGIWLLKAVFWINEGIVMLMLMAFPFALIFYWPEKTNEFEIIHIFTVLKIVLYSHAASLITSVIGFLADKQSFKKNIIILICTMVLLFAFFMFVFMRGTI